MVTGGGSSVGFGFRDITPIVEYEMARKMEDYRESGFILGCIRV